MLIKSRLFRRLSLVSVLIIMVGCSTQRQITTNVKKPTISNVSRDSAWAKRKQILTRKAAWNLNSKIALRYEQEHWTFGLNWQQRATKHFVMQIKNPVTGGNIAKLTRSNNGVTLLSNDGKTYRDVDEERLLYRQSGVRLPIKGMQYWVRGLSSPQYKVDKLVLDARGRPQAIYQAGWKIIYSRYLNNRVDAMPRKVVITRDKNNVYVKMIAKKWQ